MVLFSFSKSVGSVLKLLLFFSKWIMGLVFLVNSIRYGMILGIIVASILILPDVPL